MPSPREIEVMVLSALRSDPRSALEVLNHVSCQTQKHASIEIEQVRSALESLVSKGLVTQLNASGEQRTDIGSYAITESGVKLLKSSDSSWESLWWIAT